MLIPNCRIVLNHEVIPENIQLQKSKGQELSRDVYCNPWVYSLILYNCVSTNLGEFIQVWQVVLAMVQMPPCSAKIQSRAILLSKTTGVSEFKDSLKEFKE